MTPFDIGLIALVVMIFLVLAGLYIPVALMITSFGGVWAIKGSSGLAILRDCAAVCSYGVYRGRNGNGAGRV